MGVRNAGPGHLDYLAMDPAPKKSRCIRHAPDHLDVAWLRTPGDGTAIRPTARVEYCLADARLALCLCRCGASYALPEAAQNAQPFRRNEQSSLPDEVDANRR